MASEGAAAAQGLESGVGLGLRMRQQEAAEEQTRRANLVADENLQRQRAADKRLEDDRALEAIGREFDDLRAEGEGYIAQYGKAVPDEIGAPYKERVDRVSGTRNSLLRKRYEPVIAENEQRAKDLLMNLNSGRVDLKDVPPKDLYHAIMVQTRRDPADLIGVDGKPSRVAAAVTDIMDGMEFNNEGAMLRGANVLLEPELKVGIGEPSPHGGTIVGKQIVKLVPHPADPTKVLPVVKVYVRRGQQSGGDVARAEHVAEEGAPPGATGYYIAPITENRSSDPNDPPKAIDLRQAIDYAGQMQTLSTALSHPDIAGKLGKAAKEKHGGDDFTKAFFAVRGKMPAKAVEYKSVKKGERLVGLDTTSGKPTGDVIEGAPADKPKATGLAANIQAIENYAEENGISEAEAAAQLQQRGLLRAPKGSAGGPGGGSGGRTDPDLAGDDLLKTLKPEDARIVRGLSEGSIKPESISTKGNRREHMLALAQQYNPDANTAGKTLPQAVLKQITEVRDNATTIDRLSKTFDKAYGGKGYLGFGADKQLEASGVLGVDKDAVDWWKNYRKGAELVERHAMFGAALTPGEQQSWRNADIGPGMDPDVIERNLATRATLAKKVLDATRQDLIDAGHSEKRINAIAQRDMAVDLPPTEKARKAGAAPAAGGAQPFRLPSDAKAATNAYNRLPPGATYIDPNGVTRTKK